MKAANLVGRPISLPDDEETTTELKGPDGNISLSPESKFFYAREPGLYNLTSPGKATFAVNLAPAESQTAPLPEERLAGLKLPLGPVSSEGTAKTEARRQAMLDAELEKKQQWWRWLIGGAIILAILETWLGGRTWRQPAVASETGEAA